MKKILLFLFLIIFSFVSIFNLAYAEDFPQLNIEFDNKISGETSGIRINLYNLPSEIDEETELTILFPDGFKLPSSISQDNVKIDGAYPPLSISINSLNNIIIKLKPNFKNFTTIRFNKECFIENPKNYNKTYYIDIIFSSKSIIKSNELLFYPPENSIVLDKSFKTISTLEWIPEEFLLELTSSLAKEIYYIIDNSKARLYSKPILINNGKHILSYYGIRRNDVIEQTNSVTFHVDSKPPTLELIEPTNKSYINKLETNLIFQCRDISPVVLIYKTEKFYADEKNIVKVNASLKPGENIIAINAIDSANHSAQFEFVIFVDITPPALTILSPRNGETVCGSNVEIIGKVELGSRVMIQDFEISKDNYGNFTFKYTPQKGLNKITIKAYDKANNESRIIIEFNFIKNKVMEFVLGSNKAIVDDEIKNINPSPFYDEKSDDYYLPVRFFAENLNYTISWNSKESLLTLRKGQSSIILKPYSPEIKINIQNEERTVILKNIPTIYKGSVMISTEFLKRILFSDVIYDVKSGKLITLFCIKGD